MNNNEIKGRFAPTPSGGLHLGNLFSTLLAWLHAKAQGGRIVLRIEDLDTIRCPKENASKLAKDLEWLGLVWDEGAFCSEASESYFQSNRSEVYKHYFDILRQQKHIYPCFCSRNELHTVNAPHLSDGRFIYAGTCYNLTQEQIELRQQTRKPAYRLHVPNEKISFEDANYGPQSFNLALDNGDFIVRRSDGVYAYQLAVAIDDALMGVTEVVRGQDLLSSAPLQIYIQRILSFMSPSYLHVPLLIAPDGRRLAKRDHDMDIALLRKKYASPEPIIGYLAFLAGQLKKPEPLTAKELLHIFDSQKIPISNIIIPPELPKLI